MKKKEIVEMHMLLAEVANYADIELEEYKKFHDEEGVGPTSLQATKSKHKQGVLIIAGEIADQIGGRKKQKPK